jgi:hypothetical protein
MLSFHFGSRSFPHGLSRVDHIAFTGIDREDCDTFLWLGPVGLVIHGRPKPYVSPTADMTEDEAHAYYSEMVTAERARYSAVRERLWGGQSSMNALDTEEGHDAFLTSERERYREVVARLQNRAA